MTQLPSQTYELTSLSELWCELNKRGFRLSDNGVVLTGDGDPACATEVDDLVETLEALWV